MSFFPDFGKGVSFHLKAFQFIAKHNLWSYFILPVCITIVLASFGIYTLSSIGGNWGELINEKLHHYLVGNEDVDKWLELLYSAISGVLGFIFRILATLFFLKILRYIVLILCSPVMARLSERVDEILTGKKIPFRLAVFLHDMLRGILVSLRSMFFETMISILLFILSFIPIVNFIAYPLAFLSGWYFLGFNMMDYSYERRRMKISEGAKFTRKHKGIAVGNGMVYSLLLWIPFIGISIAPVLSVIAATLATIDCLETDSKLKIQN